MEGGSGLESTAAPNALASETANIMKNLPELSIELSIELNTVRIASSVEGPRLSPTGVPVCWAGPTAGRHLCVTISAPDFAATEQISRVHVDFTHHSNQVAMPWVCFGSGSL